jgi:nicotinamidase-related amidase
MRLISILLISCLTITCNCQTTNNVLTQQQNQQKKIMKTALLIIDIQNDYFENGKMTLVNPDSAAHNAKLVLDKFRAEKLPVIHIQHLATRPTATFFQPVTKGSEINEAVRPLNEEKLVIKHFPNSFKDTDLLKYLTDNNITDLVICGMMTHMCVDATVRAAKDLGFNITLIGDACATKDLEINGQTVKASEVQKSFLAAINSYYANVITTKEYLSKEK